jgi:hypothetical protein
MLPSERYARAAAEDFTIRFPRDEVPENSALSALIAEYFAGIPTRLVDHGTVIAVWLPTLPKTRWDSGADGEQSITVYRAAAHAGGAFTARANNPGHTAEALAAGFVMFVKERILPVTGSEETPATATEHQCSAPQDAVALGRHGPAIEHCSLDEGGHLYVDNGEYSSFVHFCPFCGEKSPKPIPTKP